MAIRASVTRGWGRLVALSVAAVLLLAGCQVVPEDELEAEFATISGVALVDVDGERVKVTLADDILSVDAAAAILAARDLAVARHPLGADVQLVIVLPAGPRDLGGAQPFPVYNSASWSDGAAADAAFEQQASFVASLAEWETLTAGPALFLHLGFTVSGVTTPEPTETEESREESGEEQAGDDAEQPSAQVVTAQLRAPSTAENVPADVDAAIAELEALWEASGGDPRGITLS